MQRRLLLLLSLFIVVNWAISAQPLDVENFRTYDGTHNNLTNTEWGAAGTNLRFVGQVGYENLIDEPAGPNRPNPRLVSNVMFAQDGLIDDPYILSDFVWLWGQFIDHDVGLTPDGNEPAMISVPIGDDWFDPFNTGQVMIPMLRNLFDPATGTNTLNPRRHPNEITAFIDGSGVYGSDEQHANWLRSFQDGKLRVSAGNLMPYNTFNGEFDAPIDPNAPHMDNPTGAFSKLFVAGDPRANENPVLLSFHTLFVREHNRICDDLVLEHPNWTDEQLYQHARKLVGGIIASIVYEEWLPAMGVQIDNYEGYNDQVHPQLMNVFTAAAFRVGHTLLNGNLLLRDNDGNELLGGSVALRDMFFNPMPVVQIGIEPFIKGMGIQVQQQMDSKVVDDVRNFLFGPPGAGGLDLAAININRGRERGLPDYNTIRDNFGLQPYQFFQQINNDLDVFPTFSNLYGGDINDIDPWVGMLAEKPVDGSIFGETLLRIMEVQFTELRDGDRFYYENDPILTEAEKNWIKHSSLHDVIMRNTGITLMQDEVFSAMPHTEICNNMTAEIAGQILTETSVPVENVTVNVVNISAPMQSPSDANGQFLFTDVPACGVSLVSPEKDDDLLNGVSTADLVLIQQHILGVLPLDSPYKVIAADANRSGSVTALDQIAIRKAILSLSTFFPNNSSWRFIPADYVFQTNDPLSEPFTDGITVEDVLAQDMDAKFIGVKVGDVTGDVDPTMLGGNDVDDRSAIALQVPDVELQAGESYAIPFSAAEARYLSGYQLALDYDETILKLDRIAATSELGADEEDFGLFSETGLLTASWVAPRDYATADVGGAPLFVLHFTALRNGQLRDALQLDNQKLRAEAYDQYLSTMDWQLNFQSTSDVDAVATGLLLYQNQPNPFRESTIIPFELPAAGWAKLTVYDALGRVLYNQEVDHEAGRHEWTLQRTDLNATGLLFYTLETADGTATRTMVVE